MINTAALVRPLYFLFRLREFFPVLAHAGIFEYFLHEVAEYGESRATSLTQFSGTEVDASVLAAYPGTAYQFRSDANKPGIGVIG